MTLPTGTISMRQVRDELWRAQYGAQIDGWSVSMSQARGLAGVSGTISMSQLQGKSSYTGMSGQYGVDYYYDTQGGTNTQYGLNATPYVAGVHGGTGNYTYNWVLVSGTAPGTSSGLNTANPTMRYTIGKFGAQYYATYRCDISDGVTTVSVTVYITIENTTG